MASRLGVANRDLRRKTDYIQAIAAAWADAATRDKILTALSPAARSALGYLAQVTRTPAALFFAEYGAIRQARRATTAAPWRNVATVSEELYYAALLGAADLKPLRSTLYLCLPNDLVIDADPWSAPPPPLPPTAPPPGTHPPAWGIAYDVAQWLILLHEQILVNAAFGRANTIWPSPHLLQQLNRRLALPDAEPLPRSPSHLHRLRLLLLLADAAELHRQRVVTPLGWAWLDEPPEQQTALLWRAWLTAAPLLRQRYAFADGLLPPPWPAPLVAALRDHPAGATVAQIAAHLLDQTDIPAQYWMHQVASLSDLQRLVARVINQVCIAFGLVAARRNNRGVVYHLTPLGAFLIGTDQSPDPAWRPAAIAAPPVTRDGTTWRLALPPTAPLRAQADLTAYADHAGATGAPSAILQQYTLNDASLARAIAAGFRWPGLATALERAGLPLDEQSWRLLAIQFARIPTVTLRSETLLHTEQPADLRAILHHPTLRPLVDSLLSATTATLTTTPDIVQRRLQDAGYAVQTAGDSLAADAPAAKTNGALWLAASLYRRLADFLPLPLPPAQLDDLLAQLSPLQRGALSATYDQLEAAFLTLLDGRLFAQPPFAGDVAAHRQRLETAVTQNQPIYLDYFSPGRNLLTRRPVTPLWLETLDNRLYLRAECLLNGRVLLFRLDRIRAIWDAPPDDVSPAA